MAESITVRIMPLGTVAPPDAELRARGPVPRRATTRAAGFDLVAWIAAPTEIVPGDWAKIGCGFAMELPEGYEAQVRPRSGLALNHGITLLNAPGTIDADYRGEVCVILYNAGREPYTVEPGARIAQLVVASLTAVELLPVIALTASDRGVGGFGSTGVE